MHISKNNFLYLFNALIFLFVALACYSQTITTFFFCLGGGLLNIFIFLRSFSDRKKNDGESGHFPSEPNLSEKNLIMEDLDREASRRRKLEQFNKN